MSDYNSGNVRGLADAAFGTTLGGSLGAVAGAAVAGLTIAGAQVLIGLGSLGALLMPTNASGSYGQTKHGAYRSGQRGFSKEKIDDTIENYSQKVYQEGGRTVYAKENGNFYDVVITNSDGKIITTVGA